MFYLMGKKITRTKRVELLKSVSSCSWLLVAEKAKTADSWRHGLVTVTMNYDNKQSRQTRSAPVSFMSWWRNELLRQRKRSLRRAAKLCHRFLYVKPACYCRCHFLLALVLCRRVFNFNVPIFANTESHQSKKVTLNLLRFLTVCPISLFRRRKGKCRVFFLRLCPLPIASTRDGVCGFSYRWSVRHCKDGKHFKMAAGGMDR